MIFVLSALIGLAFADGAAEAKFARGLLRRVSRAGAPIVLLNAREGHSCRRIVDHLAIWAARDRRVWRVDGAADAEDFAINSAIEVSRFGAFARQPGLVLGTKIDDSLLEDRVTRTIAARVLSGGDRRGWGFRSNEGIGMVFEVRPTAPFLGQGIVRSVWPLAEATGEFAGCRYYLFTRETLRERAGGDCRPRLESSGWSKADS